MGKIFSKLPLFWKRLRHGLYFGIILWLVGFIFFIHNLPRLPDAQEKYNCEGLVVFTGGYRRVPLAYALFKKNNISFLLVSGVDKKSTMSDVFQEEPKEKELITLGTMATNTRTNALETALWMKEKKISTICLLTHQYHMPRSVCELGGYIPKDRIIPIAMAPISPFYKHPRVLFFLIIEYHKVCLFYLRSFCNRVV